MSNTENQYRRKKEMGICEVLGRKKKKGSFGSESKRRLNPVYKKIRFVYFKHTYLKRDDCKVDLYRCRHKNNPNNRHLNCNSMIKRRVKDGHYKIQGKHDPKCYELERKSQQTNPSRNPPVDSMKDQVHFGSSEEYEDEDEDDEIEDEEEDEDEEDDIIETPPPPPRRLRSHSDDKPQRRRRSERLRRIHKSKESQDDLEIQSTRKRSNMFRVPPPQKPKMNSPPRIQPKDVRQRRNSHQPPQNREIPKFRIEGFDRTLIQSPGEIIVAYVVFPTHPSRRTSPPSISTVRVMLRSSEANNQMQHQILSIPANPRYLCSLHPGKFPQFPFANLRLIFQIPEFMYSKLEGVYDISINFVHPKNDKQIVAVFHESRALRFQFIPSRTNNNNTRKSRSNNNNNNNNSMNLSRPKHHGGRRTVGTPKQNMNIVFYNDQIHGVSPQIGSVEGGEYFEIYATWSYLLRDSYPQFRVFFGSVEMEVIMFKQSQRSQQSQQSQSQQQMLQQQSNQSQQQQQQQSRMLILVKSPRMKERDRTRIQPGRVDIQFIISSRHSQFDNDLVSKRCFAFINKNMMMNRFINQRNNNNNSVDGNNTMMMMRKRMVPPPAQQQQQVKNGGSKQQQQQPIINPIKKKREEERIRRRMNPTPPKLPKLIDEDEDEEEEEEVEVEVELEGKFGGDDENPFDPFIDGGLESPRIMSPMTPTSSLQRNYFSPTMVSPTRNSNNNNNNNNNSYENNNIDLTNSFENLNQLISGNSHSTGLLIESPTTSHSLLVPSNDLMNNYNPFEELIYNTDIHRSTLEDNIIY